MSTIPDNFADLFNKKTFAQLATIMSDGSPQVTPVWFDYAGGLLRVNTAKGRVKARNMHEGSPVALAILDPENPYRYVQLRGRVKLASVPASPGIFEAPSTRTRTSPGAFGGTQTFTGTDTSLSCTTGDA